MEKSYCLNTSTRIDSRKENVAMDIGSYFQILIYTLMVATLVVLVLVFLDIFYGKEEKQE